MKNGKMNFMQNVKKIIVELDVLLSEKRLSEAFTLLQLLAEATKNGSVASVVDEMKLVYEQMLSFALKGTADAQREQILLQLLQKSYALFDDLLHAYYLSESSFFEYKQKRERKINTSISVCFERLYELQDKASLDDLLADVFKTQSADSQNADIASLVQDLCYSVLFTTRFSDDEIAQLTAFFSDESFSVDSRVVVVSALMLSALNFFQVEKLVLLFTLSRTQIELIRQRALVAVVFLCQRYVKRIVFYENLLLELQQMAKDQQLVSELEVVVCHLIRSQETEKVNRKIKEDLLPDMMRISPKLNDKWNEAKANDFDEETAMDEMQELFEETGLSEKIQQLGEMQREGSDIYMSTFSSLKTFPFFFEAFNWLMPFSSENDAVKTLFESDNDFISLLMSNNMMCDSDKYSFCFSLMQLPASQMDFMKQNLKTEIEQTKVDINDRLLTDSHLMFSLQTNSYVQSLYRFYKLFPQKMSYNPFVRLSSLTEIDVLWNLFDEKSLLSVADFYFSKKMYSETLALYTRKNLKNTSDVNLLRKMAYAFQRIGEYEKALDIYIKIELSAPEQKWLLRQMAYCHRKMGETDQALDCYKRLLELNPNDYKVLMNVANCLYEQKKYTEALAVYFKIDYLNPDNRSVLSAVAWCSFLCGKVEQSEKYFAKIPTEQLFVLDFVRWAFISFLQNDMDRATMFFQKAFSLDGTMFWETFNNVATFLMNFGLNELAFWHLTEYIKLRIKN